MISCLQEARDRFTGSGHSLINCV